MAWTEYIAVSGKDAAQLTKELIQRAKDGWKPILLSAGPNAIVAILEHVPKAPGQS